MTSTSSQSATPGVSTPGVSTRGVSTRGVSTRGVSTRGTKNLLVVSGGGARGAWGVGLANYLDETGKRYHAVVGTSTGSLMAPFILLRQFDELNRAYTSVRQRDIFNVNPFRADGGIRPLNALWRLLTGAETLGESEPLRGLIGRFMSWADYAQIRAAGLDFAVAVANHRTHRVEYRFASRVPDYKEMVNWMWASANEPVFMSLFKTPNPDGTTDYWVDGGVRENVPVVQGLKLALADPAYEAVDVIVNNLPVSDDPTARWPPNGKVTILNSLFRTLLTYRNGVRDANVRLGRLMNRLGEIADPALTTETAERPLTLTFYFMPDRLYRLIANELLFDPATMTTLLNAGRAGEFVRQPGLEALTAAASGTHSFTLSRAALQAVLNE
jgi:predicted acylesterase/phospholipase RssA